MEKKLKHRILALLVILAMIIVLSPLFDSKKNIINLTPIVKAPPFPDGAKS